MKPLKTVIFLLCASALACTTRPSPEAITEDPIVVDPYPYWSQVDSADRDSASMKFAALKRFIIADSVTEHVTGDTAYSFRIDTSYAPHQGTMLMIDIQYPGCRDEYIQIETFDYHDPPLVGGQACSWSCEDTTTVWLQKEELQAKIKSVLDASLKLMRG